jgi:hypothetical protein
MEVDRMVHESGMQHLTKALSWIVLLGTVVLLQVHGIAFWRSQVGSYGIGWSLLLEVVALWLWARPQWVSRLLGAVASILLLLGPLVQIATPLLDALGSHEHIDGELAITSGVVAGSPSHGRPPDRDTRTSGQALSPTADAFTKTRTANLARDGYGVYRTPAVSDHNDCGGVAADGRHTEYYFTEASALVWLACATKDTTAQRTGGACARRRAITSQHSVRYAH